jgi:hypothetical protein
MASTPDKKSKGKTAEEYLWQATRARDTRSRLSFAQLGLAADPDSMNPQTRFLLLRQLYLVQLEIGKLGQARGLTEEMVSMGVMKDTAYHDRSRVLFVLGETSEAIESQRQAARFAPPVRRSFHFWSLATLQQHVGASKAAIDSLDHGLRWSKRDRPLLEAHQALIILEGGDAVRDLTGIIDRLLQSPNREGYGRYILGMLYTHMGDAQSGIVHLSSFLNRNASADRAKSLTLQRELERARQVVSSRAS